MLNILDFIRDIGPKTCTIEPSSRYRDISQSRELQRMSLRNSRMRVDTLDMWGSSILPFRLGHLRAFPLLLFGTGSFRQFRPRCYRYDYKDTDCATGWSSYRFQRRFCEFTASTLILGFEVSPVRQAATPGTFKTPLGPRWMRGSRSGHAVPKPYSARVHSHSFDAIF